MAQISKLTFRIFRIRSQAEALAERRLKKYLSKTSFIIKNVQNYKHWCQQLLANELVEYLGYS